MQGLARHTPDPASPGKSTAGSGQGLAITPADVRKLFLKRKWIILVCLLAGLGIAIYKVETAIPEYEAVASVDLDLNRTSNIGFSNLVNSNYSNDWNGYAENTQLRIMQSGSVAKDVIQKLELYKKPPFSSVFGKGGYQGKITPSQMQAMSGMLKGGIQILMIPQTNLVEIHFRNPDPAVAKSVANEIVPRQQNLWVASGSGSRPSA